MCQTITKRTKSAWVGFRTLSVRVPQFNCCTTWTVYMFYVSNVLNRLLLRLWFVSNWSLTTLLLLSKYAGLLIPLLVTSQTNHNVSLMAFACAGAGQYQTSRAFCFLFAETAGIHENLPFSAKCGTTEPTDFLRQIASTGRYWWWISNYSQHTQLSFPFLITLHSSQDWILIFELYMRFIKNILQRQETSNPMLIAANWSEVYLQLLK